MSTPGSLAYYGEAPDIMHHMNLTDEYTTERIPETWLQQLGATCGAAAACSLLCARYLLRGELQLEV